MATSTVHRPAASGATIPAKGAQRAFVLRPRHSGMLASLWLVGALALVALATPDRGESA